MKFVSPPHRGTTCWCRWAAMPAPATEPRLMPMLKPCGPDAWRSARTARLVNSENSGFGTGQLGVVGHVPVGADQDVAGVVRIQVEHRVHQRAAGDDQAVLVAQLRRLVERAALVLAGPRGHALPFDVRHPVR